MTIFNLNYSNSVDLTIPQTNLMEFVLVLNKNIIKYSL